METRKRIVRRNGKMITQRRRRRLKGVTYMRERIEMKNGKMMTKRRRLE